MTRAFAAVVVFVATGFSLFTVCSTAEAQIRTFPYEAKVIAEEAVARSGAGEAYYPTLSIPRDTVVTVHRHDPGGWYMIDPPEGSFSWIPERFVKRLSDTEGEVTQENAPAWVGSSFGDEVSVFQRRMKSGEKVTILDQKQIDTTSGIQSMLKIVPPARERRWVPGSALVPVDDRLRQQMNSDPYSLPGNARRPDTVIAPEQALASGKTQNGHGVLVDVPSLGPSAQLAELQQIRREQQELASIDRRFRDMIFRDASQWDLDSIENEYRVLQQGTTHKPISGQIDMRYPAIERYRRHLATLNEVRQRTTQTEMRDAELLSRHTGGFGQTGQIIASPGPEAMLPPGEPMQVAQAFEQFLQRDTSNIATREGTPGSVAQESAEPLALAVPQSAPAGVITPGSPQNRFVGAGIVQKATDGSETGYVLMAPSGRILADLKETGGVKLESFIGQQVGVQGSRWSEQEKRDMIEVSAVETVRLRQ